MPEPPKLPPPKGETAAEVVPHTHDLAKLREAASSCRACPLGEKATQTVFGEGPRKAHMVLIGEQPGDQEDLQGHPFVGPAGKVLERALRAAEIPRSDVYETNAVKHFSYRPLGKKRLHSKPTWANVNACRPWLRAELDSIHPQVVVCLGSTAAQTLLGKTFSITRERGQVLHTPWAPALVVTFHPSAILRTPEKMAREQAFEALVSDLRLAYAELRKG